LATRVGPKNILATILILFIVVSVTYLIVNVSRQPTSNPAKSDQAVTQAVTPSPEHASDDEAAEAQHTVIAYYFHGPSRCQTCRTPDVSHNRAIRAEELQSEMLEWHAVNVEEPQNEHFIGDYELLTRSLVLVDVEGGNQTRWKNLERVWELVGDKGAFISYVQKETRAYRMLGASVYGNHFHCHRNLLLLRPHTLGEKKYADRRL